ncbi:hypothetical protein [Spirosoma utsteinense]|uniref:POTRA domain-containing protein n=1 Tax=Spirosoma utsteinense TaxID=2585773 RepID=A0ABR6W5L0_9BACT|nr:hypothetical protein [Spirosoma utsteinense]MBC3786213.1 hypothetical protein [Spirosoma utsteinense]MBC3791838.1 hypothetical protein [Spirosoma utsteinense]
MKTVLVLLLLGPVAGWSQSTKITPADVQRRQSYLIMRDSSVVRGQVIRQDSSLITVRKRNRQLTFIEADQLVRVMANRPDVPLNLVPVRTVGPVRVFVFKDGTQVEGQFVRRDSAMITVRKRNGQLTYFEPELLARMDTVQVEARFDSDRNFPGRFAPWLLMGPTAYNPDKGRFYYRNTWLLLNEFQYGITRNWSIGVNFATPIPYLIYSDTYLGSGQFATNNSRLVTKLSAPIGDRFRLGVQASYQSGQQFTYTRGRDVWTFQALASVGSSQHNVTLGYGRRMQANQGLKQYSFFRVPDQSFLSLGIIQKLSPRLSFVSDNTLNLGRRYGYYADSKASVSAALRIDRRRHAFDLGVFTLIHQYPYLWDGRTTQLFPYIGYNLLIGHD